MKRKAKQEKIEAQKAAGTYMTKAQKEKAQKNQARIEAMRAAGMLSTVPAEKDEKESSAPKSSAAMFSKKKKKGQSNPNSSQSPSDTASPRANDTTVEAPDDWDAEPDVESHDANDEPVKEAEIADEWDMVDEDEVTAKLIAIKVSIMVIPFLTYQGS